MEKPKALSERVEIKKENLVGDQYVIATEDLTHENALSNNKDMNEIKEYITGALNITNKIRIVETDRKHIEKTIESLKGLR